MNPSDEQQGTNEPPAGKPSTSGDVPDNPSGAGAPPAGPPDAYDDGKSHEPEVKAEPAPPAALAPVKSAAPVAKSGGGGKTPPPPPPKDDDDEEDNSMLRMSFMEHLEELRTRIIRALMGIAVAFAISLTYTYPLWDFVSEPAKVALKSLGYAQTDLVQIEPMETFNVIWFKLPVLCAVFLSAPWILYQVWAFISPGLYKKERRWAVPFVIGAGGLFILGGCFAYFVVFRFGLTFLLSIGKGHGVIAMVSVTEYFNLFVNVVMGVGIIFELPVLIFLFTLLRIVTPSFLIRHSRYAILGIFILAAIITPTPDVFNLMLFAVPMCFLFYFGIFAAYLLVLHRENRKFPWQVAITIVLAVLLLLALVVYMSITKYGMHLVPRWPFLTR